MTVITLHANSRCLEVYMHSKANTTTYVSPTNASPINSSPYAFLSPLFVVPAGVIALALLSQIAVPLPGTPVPLTGQTFGVLLFALLFGANLSAVTVATYFGLGLAGLPIMANAQSLALIGPTSGYLVGMIAAVYIIGLLADRGLAKTTFGAFLLGLFGSAIILFVGAIGLRFFIPANAVIAAGVLPFIVGDVVKSAVAALIVTSLHGRRRPDIDGPRL